MGIEHAQYKDEAITQVRNDRIKQNGMGMAARRAFDPCHQNLARAHLTCDKIIHSSAVAFMFGAAPTSATARAGLLLRLAWLGKFAVQSVRILQGKEQGKKNLAFYRIFSYYMNTPRVVYTWSALCV